MNICKDVNGCGHVAIIKSVNLNTGILIRVDANWNGKCAVIEHTMSVTKNSSGKYTIGGTDSNYLLGWQSKS
jgi:surface antigen